MTCPRPFYPLGSWTFSPWTPLQYSRASKAEGVYYQSISEPYTGATPDLKVESTPSDSGKLDTRSTCHHKALSRCKTRLLLPHLAGQPPRRP